MLRLSVEPSPEEIEVRKEKINKRKNRQDGEKKKHHAHPIIIASTTGLTFSFVLLKAGWILPV